MIFPLSIVSLLALVCLGLLASPFPFLAPGVVLGLVGVAVLYRKPTWGLLGIAAILPFEGLFKDSAFPGSKILGASLVLILMLQLAIHQLPAERLRSNIWRFLLSFMALYLLSLLNSDNMSVSLGHLRDLSVGLVLFIITLLIGRELNLNTFAKLVTLSVAVTCAMTLFSVKYQDAGRAAGLLKDPNNFALMIAFAVPLALLLVMRSSNMLHRMFWGGCTLLLLVGITKTESRSGLVVLFISLLIGAWHYRALLPRIRPRHLGFAMLGLAGLSNKFSDQWGMIPGIILGTFGRFVCAFLSGLIFFGMYAPEGQNVVIYSMVYNGLYLVPEAIICIVLAMIPQIRQLAKRLALQD